MKLVFSLLMIILANNMCLAQELALVTFPVPSTTIQAGEIVSNESLIERDLLANPIAVSNHMTSRASIVGKVAKRRLAAGMAIPKGALRDAFIFKEGDRVVLEFASGGLSIRSSGLALQPGVVGQSVKVRNIDSGIVVTGIARADGSVTVGER